MISGVFQLETKRLIYKVLGVGAGLAFVVFGFQERSHVSRLRSTGKIAVVEPIAGYTEHKSRGNTTYTAEFHFTTEKGTKIVKKQSFPEELLPDFSAQQPVKVLYNPNNESDFIFERERASWFLVLAGLGLAAAALLFV
jgi:hypothetical protein